MEDDYRYPFGRLGHKIDGKHRAGHVAGEESRPRPRLAVLQLVACLTVGCGAFGDAIESTPPADAGASDAPSVVDAAIADISDDSWDADATDDGDESDASVGAESDTGPPSCGVSDAGPMQGAMTVHGTVVGERGFPLPGVRVTIAGSSTITDAVGAFSIGAVAAPYDVRVDGGSASTLFIGASRTDPILHVRGDIGTPRRTATVIAALSGGTGFPVPASHKAAWRVALGGHEVGGGNLNITPGPVQGAFAYWYGPTTMPATAYALEWAFADPDGPPTTYYAIGSAQLALTDGETSNASIDLTSSSLTESTLAGTVVVPDLYANQWPSFTLWLSPEPGAAFQLTFLSSSSGGPSKDTFEFPTVLGAGTFALDVAIQHEEQWLVTRRVGLAGDAHDVALVVAEGISPVTPPDKASAVDPCSTEFSWTPAPDAVYRLSVEPWGVYGPYYDIVTTSTTVDLSAVSAAIAVPSEAEFVWSVVAARGFQSVDDALGEASFAEALDVTTPSSDAQLAATIGRRFTSK